MIYATTYRGVFLIGLKPLENLIAVEQLTILQLNLTGFVTRAFYYAGANVYSKRGADLTKVTLHEYIHTYQNNYTIWGNDIAAENAGLVEDYSPGPVWLEEGVAEYLALRIMYQETNYPSFISKMKENLESARWIKKTHGLTLKDVETRQGQARVNKICDGCGGRLYYDHCCVGHVVSGVFGWRGQTYQKILPTDSISWLEARV